MAILKQLGITFVTGGIFGVIGQFIFTILLGLVGPTSPLLGTYLLWAMGLIGGIMFIFGAYQKLEKIAGFGAIMPFSGLVSAVAGAIAGPKQAGAPMGKAIKNSMVMVVAYVIGIGTLLGIIVGIIAFLVK